MDGAAKPDVSGRRSRRWPASRARTDVRRRSQRLPQASRRLGTAIFYRLIEDGIDVVRILHRRMDPGRHLD